MITNETNGSRVSANDPERIRALAHPLRLALLEFLDDTGEATATECAKHTGESVANCSFHLRLLARYGFIEPAEPRGRERPWRPSPHREMFTPDDSVPGSIRAVVELAEVAARQGIEGFVDFLRERESRADELSGRSLPSSMTKDTFWATPEETAVLMQAVGDLFEPFVARATDPAARPAGALLMRWFATSHPDLHTDPAPGPEASDAPHPSSSQPSEEA
jgi:DNA-binding transcriptional ArsR family regulator